MRVAMALLTLTLLCLSVTPALATDPTRFTARCSGGQRTQGEVNQCAFQSAVVEACRLNGDHLLDIPAGTFDLARQPGANGAVTVRRCTGLSIRGAGRVATTLRMVPHVTVLSEDFHIFNIEDSADIEMHSLTLDGSREGFSGPARQIHLVRTLRSKRLDFHDMAFVNGFNDAIKFLETSDVSVSGSSFRNFRQGGISWHSGNDSYRIVGNAFHEIADNHISSEPGGGVGILNATIMGNTFGPHGGQSALVVSLGGPVAGKPMNVVFSNNNVLDGQVQAINMERVTVSSNTLVFKGGLVLNLKSGVVSITGNIITAEATDSEAFCVRGVTQNTPVPISNWSIVGNVCRHKGGGGIFYFGGFGPVTIARNTIVNMGSRTNATGIVVSELGSESLRGFAVTGNSIMEEMTGIVISASHGGSIDSGVVVGNTIVSSRANAAGIVTQWSNHQGSPAPVKCRADANVIDVSGVKIRNSGTTVGAAPGEGCVPHGDQVP